MINHYMDVAIQEARRAAAAGEVPVGAAIFHEGRLLAKAHNVTKTNAAGHAELLAIAQAGQALNDWRLTDCELYVTLEPCPMCAAGIMNARLKRVYYGAFDKQYGAAGSKYNLFAHTLYGHTVEVYGGICEEPCRQLLTDFFQTLRRK